MTLWGSSGLGGLKDLKGGGGLGREPVTKRSVIIAFGEGLFSE